MTAAGDKKTLPAFEKFVENLRKIWAELSAVGDAELVTVEEKDETVKVWRKADKVHVHVEKQGKEEVRVEVPVALVDGGALYDALGRVPRSRSGACVRRDQDHAAAHRESRLGARAP